METLSSERIVNKCLVAIHDHQFSLTDKQFIVTQLMSFIEYLYKGNDIVCNSLLSCLDDYVEVLYYQHREK